jgi:hypothetical protein
MVKIGDHVLFADSRSRPVHAVVSAVWPKMKVVAAPDDPAAYDGKKAVPDPDQAPSLNVVFVSMDEARHDSYGRQVERETSLAHVSAQPAPGMYWCRPEEYDPARDRALRIPAGLRRGPNREPGRPGTWEVTGRQRERICTASSGFDARGGVTVTQPAAPGDWARRCG